jgi:hypothetical protein
LLLVLVVLCGAMTAAWFLSPRLLYIEHEVAPADIIIVLGGDAEGRVLRKEEGRIKKEEGGLGMWILV